ALDANGDGQVTPDELFAGHAADPTETLGNLLPAIQKDLHLGEGGEDLAALPGVSLAFLTAPSRTHEPVRFRADVDEGNSRFVAATNQLPAVQLAAFADGSVRRSEDSNAHVRRDSSRFRDAEFFAGLSPVDPALSRGAAGWTGLFNVTDPDGNSIIGVVIGVHGRGEKRVRGMVMVQDGTGKLAAAPGTGTARVVWKQGRDGPFRAAVDVTPFPTRQGD